MKIIINSCCLLFLLLIAACKSEPAEEEPRVVTPVQVTMPSRETLAEVIELPATSTLLKKDYARATVAGYIESVKVSIGDMVSAGSVLYTMRTKEAAAIGKNKVLDSLLNFSGMITVRASKAGRIDSLGHQQGDYVQEGELLALISESSSLAFVLNVPFESRQYIKANTSCDIVLPDQQVIKGTFSAPLSSVDAVSQTLSFLVRPSAVSSLPENLVVKVRVQKSAKADAVVLPKEAVLSNETLTEFWIMQLLNDSTAIKVPVTTGIESDDKVEIVTPALTGKERILLTGQYGLADTALVSVEK